MKKAVVRQEVEGMFRMGTHVASEAKFAAEAEKQSVAGGKRWCLANSWVKSWQFDTITVEANSCHFETEIQYCVATGHFKCNGD